MQYIHPVIACKERGNTHVADATIGMGGHAYAILCAYNNCILHAIDADKAMIEHAMQRLSSYKNRVVFHNQWFDDFFVQHSNVDQHHTSNSIQYDAILMDFGVCMYHFKKSQRGFSRFSNEILDMRLGIFEDDSNKCTTAESVLTLYSEKELANVFFEYGEERASYRWAKKIVSWRKDKPMKTVKNLLDALQLGKKPSDAKIITRIFQALRIEVNGELTRIYNALPHAWQCLRRGGRLLLISFHSLEDRLAKYFSHHVSGFIKNEKKIPIHNSNSRFLKNACCNWSAMQLDAGRACVKKPLTVSDEELDQHPESRSAKLRIIEKL